MAILREAWVSALTQPVASAVSMVIVAGMCVSVLLTTGRTVGAEQAVLASIDSAGTRSIIVRAESDAGLDTGVLGRLAHVDGVEWLAAFGPAHDVTNVAIPEGTRVPLRTLWSLTGPPREGALASREALVELGMTAPVGAVESAAGSDVDVVGELDVPDYLEFLEPVLVTQREIPVTTPELVSVLVVVAERADLVAPLTEVVGSVLAVADPASVTVTTSENLAALRAVVEGQLGQFGRNLVVVIFAASACLVAAIVYGLVMLRRRDFGRRRALGATRALIVQLVMAQVAFTSAAGAGLGSLVALGVLAASGDPLPSIEFIVSVALLAVVTGQVAAAVPAIAASRRDPLRELRVP